MLTAGSAPGGRWHQAPIPAWMFPGSSWESSSSCAGRAAPALPDQDALQGPSRAGPEQHSSRQCPRSLGGDFLRIAPPSRELPRHPWVSPSLQCLAPAVCRVTAWKGAPAAGTSARMSFLPLLSTLGTVSSKKQENRRQGITHSPPCCDFVLNGSCQANLFIKATFPRNIPETQAKIQLFPSSELLSFTHLHIANLQGSIFFASTRAWSINPFRAGL